MNKRIYGPDARADNRADKGQEVCGPLAPIGPDPRGGAVGPTEPRRPAIGVGLTLLIVDVEGKPEPEPRPRMDRRSGRAYVPRSAHDWKHAIRVATRMALTSDGVGAVPEPRVAFAVGFVFRFARPKSHYRTGRFSSLLRDAAPQLHTCKPDLDNLIKAAVDALGDFDGGAALVWADDSQVDRYVGTPTKRWADPGERAGLTLVIERV